MVSHQKAKKMKITSKNICQQKRDVAQFGLQFDIGKKKKIEFQALCY